MTRSHRITGFDTAPGGYNRSQRVKDACRLRSQGKTGSDAAVSP